MAMTVGDIVEEISEKTEHFLSDASIIRKINNLMTEIFRDLKRIITTSRLDLESGLATYPLPCSIYNIYQLMINGEEYTYQNLKAEDCGNVYYYIDGSFGIYPTPEKDVAKGILILHYKVPEELSTSDMNAEPDLDADFRMLLVWGVSKDVTKNKEDKAEYRDNYNNLLGTYISSTELPLSDIGVG
jgi:hypothetical protein